MLTLEVSRGREARERRDSTILQNGDKIKKEMRGLNGVCIMGCSTLLIMVNDHFP